MQAQHRAQQPQAPHLLPNLGLLGTIQLDYDRRGHGGFFGNTRSIRTSGVASRNCRLLLLISPNCPAYPVVRFSFR